MRDFLLLYFISFVFFRCNSVKAGNTKAQDSTRIYPTVSYLTIRLDSAAHLPSNPYIVAFESGNKKVVFCGVNHLTDYKDTNHPLFSGIENKFFAFKPDIAVNEGGDISKKIYSSKQAAIVQDGEIGLTKFLCDSLHIKTVDGDPAFELECREVLKKYSTGELLAYLVTERLMWGLKAQPTPDSRQIEKGYDAFVNSYIVHEGKLALTKAERSFDFYKTHYQQLLKRPFALTSLEPTNPFEPNSKFQEIGRTSKKIRDQFLLKTVDSLLNTNNKIFIVFGGWHLLTCQPGLEEIVKRHSE